MGTVIDFVYHGHINSHPLWDSGTASSELIDSSRISIDGLKGSLSAKLPKSFKCPAPPFELALMASYPRHLPRGSPNFSKRLGLAFLHRLV